MSPHLDALRRLLRRAPPPTAKVLADALGASQPTVSRALAALGDEVLRLGKARQARYALARPLGTTGTVGARWPLYRIDADGRAQALGELAAAGAEGYVLRPGDDRPLPALMHDEFALGWYDGLPWFLDDLRPQGFLGRAFARRVAPTLHLHDDPTRWSGDQVALALLAHGHDGPGDLVLGDTALQRALAGVVEPRDAITPDARATRYPELAQAALQGEAIGSSAGGEQPKFTVTLHDAPRARAGASPAARRARVTSEHRSTASSGWRACIVKFSDRRSTPAGRRWADLLICESLAAAVLRDHGIDAARCDIVEAADRVFLEVERFDRTPTLGRRGLASLRALDAAFFGHGAIDWWRFAPQLERDGWITRDDAHRLRVLGLFGALIGNTDMHLGNVSLVLRDERPLALAPVYDMLPMRFAPTAGGEVVARDFVVTVPTPDILDAWREAARIAGVFWAQVQDEPSSISRGFRVIAKDALRRIDVVAQRLG